MPAEASDEGQARGHLLGTRTAAGDQQGGASTCPLRDKRRRAARSARALRGSGLPGLPEGRSAGMARAEGRVGGRAPVETRYCMPSLEPEARRFPGRHGVIEAWGSGPPGAGCVLPGERGPGGNGDRAGTGARTGQHNGTRHRTRCGRTGSPASESRPSENRPRRTRLPDFHRGPSVLPPALIWGGRINRPCPQGRGNS